MTRAADHAQRPGINLQLYNQLKINNLYSVAFMQLW